jgi:hypothetical protein
LINFRPASEIVKVVISVLSLKSIIIRLKKDC